MVNKHISNDLKRAALRLKDRGHDSDSEICRITGISLSTLYRTRRRQLLTGDVANAPAIGRGRPRKLMHIDCQYLIHLARHKPTLFLDEYNQRLIDFRHLPASLATIHRTLTRAGLNLKQVQKLASERKPLVRAGFIRRISQYPAHYLVTLDEVSKDNRTYARMWGRASRGERVEKHNPFVRKERFSMLGAMALDEGIIAARVVEGSFTRELFLEFLRDDLLPCTNPYPAPRSVIVLDNARIHHSQEVVDLIESYGCRVEYLPPYSPDLNPIEQVWSVIKSHLRRIGLSHGSKAQQYHELYRACEVITPEMTWGFFHHSGYI